MSILLLLAALLPVVPLLSVYVAKREKQSVELLFPYAVMVSSAVVCVALLATALFSDKMPGTDAKPKASGSRYSYEFYHGPWGKGAPR